MCVGSWPISDILFQYSSGCHLQVMNGFNDSTVFLRNIHIIYELLE